MAVYQQSNRNMRQEENEESSASGACKRLHCDIVDDDDDDVVVWHAVSRPPFLTASLVGVRQKVGTRGMTSVTREKKDMDTIYVVLLDRYSHLLSDNAVLCLSCCQECSVRRM